MTTEFGNFLKLYIMENSNTRTNELFAYAKLPGDF